nr:hypothetical protein GCM10020093_104640 [Planobispora longispora]
MPVRRGGGDRRGEAASRGAPVLRDGARVREDRGTDGGNGPGARTRPSGSRAAAPVRRGTPGGPGGGGFRDGEIQEESHETGRSPGNLPLSKVPFPGAGSGAVFIMINTPIPATPAAVVTLIRTYVREALFSI